MSAGWTIALLCLAVVVLLAVCGWQHFAHERQSAAQSRELEAVLEAVPTVFDEMAAEHREKIRAQLRAEVEAQVRREHEEAALMLQAFVYEANRRFTFGEVFRGRSLHARRERVL